MEMRARLHKTALGWQLAPLDELPDTVPFEDGQVVIVASTTESPSPSRIEQAGRDDLIDPAAAKAQLDLVLSFFARVEGKLSVVLAIDLGMLSLAFTKALPFTAVHLVPAIALAVFLFCQACALRALYRGSFPSLDGGHSSLVYFREVSKLRESDYKDRFAKLRAPELACDHLEQAWRNSRILTMKFDQLQLAYQWTAISIVPWVIALVLLAARVVV